MLDLNFVVNNKEKVLENNLNRGVYIDVDKIEKLSIERKDLIKKININREKKNKISKEIGILIKSSDLDKKKKISKFQDEIKTEKEDTKKLEEALIKIEKEINLKLEKIPNILHESTPLGKEESNNVEIKRYLEPRKFKFEPKDHVEIGTALDILDFERSAKITGSRFVVKKGLGSKLSRALFNFMIDTHVDINEYTEVSMPYIVNGESLHGTGQFPKFKEDVFKLEIKDKDWYLNPTAEVPTINYYRGEIINQKLPIKYVSFTTAFRSEAGSAGKDTRGMMRVHQFDKVELIQFTKPENSYIALEEMLVHAETILKKLKLPYRVLKLCSSEVGFSMTKTYDIEVYIPSQKKYREIASISNSGDFQARRSGIRYKNNLGKTEFVHTLNGSGLPIGRTLIAILENYQNEDGTVEVPDELRKYLGVEVIEKE